MDALKLRLRAKDQLHPLLQELVTGYARFKGSKDWEGRSRMVGWCVFFFVHTLREYIYSRGRILVGSLQADNSECDEGVGGDFGGAVKTGTSDCSLVCMSHEYGLTLVSLSLVAVRRGSCLRGVLQEFEWGQGGVMTMP